MSEWPHSIEFNVSVRRKGGFMVSPLIIIGITLALSVVVIVILSVCLLKESDRRNKKKHIVIKAGRAKVAEGANSSVSSCKKAALLIDGDNISSKFIVPILENIGKTNNAVIVYSCVYGLGSKLQNWTSVARDYGIEQRFTSYFIKGKSSTDFNIVMDCMDLLYGTDVDIFVLCSSDSDYSGIADRLKKEGKKVIGMGYGLTPRVFRLACSKFYNLDEKDASEENLGNVLSGLISFHKYCAPYKDVRAMVSQRFDLERMGFCSFDNMLNHFGYTSNREGNRIVVMDKAI